jgi:hypothetical protein
MPNHRPATGLIDPGPIAFETTLLRDDRSGAACFVEIPFDLKQTYGKGNLIPIKATFDGSAEYQGSLAKMGGPCAVLLVRKDILARLGKGSGDPIHIHLALDTTPRVVTLAGDASKAIAASLAAQTTWEHLSYSHQREYALWIEGAKKPETRAHRIEKTVAMLAEGKRLK